MRTSLPTGAAQFSTGEKCSVFTRRRHRWACSNESELLEFKWERTAEEWSEEKRMRIHQQSLLGDSKPPLEKIPFDFSYRYRCSTSGCRGHDQKIVDWEISEMFRTLRLGHEGSALEKVQQKWADDLWGSSHDTYLYVGNQLAHPRGFLVLGVFRPKKRASVG